MPYTRTWAQVLNLLGSRDADEIDDASREAHVDFTERLEDIVYDVEADPWVLKVPGVASDGTQAINLPVMPAVLATGAVTRTGLAVHPSAAGATATLLIPVIVESGSTIIAFGLTGLKTQIGAVVQASLWGVRNDGSGSTIATLSITSVGSVQNVDSGVLNHPIDAYEALYVNVLLTADAAGATSAQAIMVRVNRKLAGTP